MKGLASFVKEKRKLAGSTQKKFAERVGVALTVVRREGKADLSNVNHVLMMFGSKLAPICIREIETEIL